MRTPQLLRRSTGKSHGRGRSAVEPCEKRMNKTPFAGPPREGERKLLGSGWDPSSLQPGHLSRPHLRLGYWRPCAGSGVPRLQAAWRIAPRPPFRLRLRLQRLQRLQGAFLPRLRGRKAKSRPGPGRATGPRPDGGRAGTRRAALKRRRRPGQSGLRALALARGGGGTVQRCRGEGGRRGPAQREQSSVKGIVLATQSCVRARPLGAKLGAPRRAQASSCCTSAPRPGARPALAVPRTPAPAFEPREQRGNLSSNYDPSP